MIESLYHQAVVAVAIVSIAGILLRLFTGSRGKIEATSLLEAQYFVPTVGVSDEERRDFVELMVEKGKKLIFFYGSQTGTSENYATRLAKEAKARYGVSSLVCSPHDYDFNVLDKVPADSLVVFVVSTYGDGEPTDNAVDLVNSLKVGGLELTGGGTDLPNLKFAIFCIGNSTYENFNTVGKFVDKSLLRTGASRVGPCGIGDEDNDLEEAYIAWKDALWVDVERVMEWKNGAGLHVADFELNTQPIQDEEQVYLGELSERALTNSRGVQDANNPFISPIIKSRDLFHDAERNCVFAEFDITGSGMSYEAGDHVAVWPVNSEKDVDRLLRVLDLYSKKDDVIEVKSLDPGLAKVPFPVPTTYSSIFRHYLDISQLTPRQILEGFTKFAPTEKARMSLERMSTNKEIYQKEVAEMCLNFGEILMTAAGDTLDRDENSCTVWSIPFERIISATSRLHPRYYSICSSPRLFPNAIHVTAVVVRDLAPSKQKVVYGLTTNYLMSIQTALGGISSSNHSNPRYDLEGPRKKFRKQDTYATPIHTRLSKFRLPNSVKLPVIMIGPGTGVAPFRAFVQERVALAKRAKQLHGPDALKDWGTLDLFYGCRRSGADFLFKDEWDDYAKELDGKFRLHVAFSREPGQAKVYVQHLIEKEFELVCEALLRKKGHVYICGDARNMAREVEAALERALGKGSESGHVEGAKQIKTLKDRKRMALDVW